MKILFFYKNREQFPEQFPKTTLSQLVQRKKENIPDFFDII